MKLYINEIFESVSGESGVNIKQGEYVTFIRLQGCNMECSYCDTKDSIPINKDNGIEAFELVSKIKTKKVLITGGEPLLQKEALRHLIIDLNVKGIIPQIETNGSISLTKNFNDVLCTFVVDYKFNYNTKEVCKQALSMRNCAVKFVLSSHKEALKMFLFLKNFIKEDSKIIVSTVDENFELLKTVMNSPLNKYNNNITYSVQLHKILGVK